MSIRRVYETTIIINPSIGDAQIETVIEKILQFVKNHYGDIEEINK
jgi:ribosomal protein S6